MISKVFDGLFCMALLNTGVHAQCGGTPLTNSELQGFRGETVSLNCVTGCVGWMSSNG